MHEGKDVQGKALLVNLESNWKDWEKNHFLKRQGKCCFLSELCGLGDSCCLGQLQGMLGVELG